MISILLLFLLLVLNLLIYGYYINVNNKNTRIISSSLLLNAKAKTITITSSTTTTSTSASTIVNKISKIISNNTKHSSNDNDNNFKFKFEKKIKYLTRVSRVDSQEKWIKEIEIIRDSLNNNTILNNDDKDLSKIVELSKELLYSGIPEQCIELYAAYYDMILNTKNNNNITNSISNDTMNFPVIHNPNLILITTRAFIAMDDLKNALKLLQATSRYGIIITFNTITIIIFIID